MEKKELRLFVNQNKESEEVVRLLRMGGVKNLVVVSARDVPAPELQIGSNQSDRIRGFEAIRKWLFSQDKKVV